MVTLPLNIYIKFRKKKKKNQKTFFNLITKYFQKYNFTRIYIKILFFYLFINIKN